MVRAFSLFPHITTVTVKSGVTWDQAKTLLHKDLIITPKRLSLQQSYLKTNQFSERAHTVVLPYVRGYSSVTVPGPCRF